MFFIPPHRRPTGGHTGEAWAEAHEAPADSSKSLLL